MSATVFLGGGRITGALVAGLRGAAPKLRGRGRIVVYDRHPEKLRQLRRRYGVHTEPSLRRALANGGLILVAVRPADVLPLLGAIGPLPEGALVVSLAAGVSLRALRRAMPQRVVWARAMPSPACRYGRGLTALAFDPDLSRSARRRVRQFFERTGAVIEIPEREFDAFTVVYSTSQGYHALAARIRAARKMGLSARTALLAAAHGLAEGVRAASDTGASLEELLAEAATPGGIAAEVLHTLRAGGYDRLVERACRAGLSVARRAARKRRLPRGTRRPGG
jgi:pyrroline-5-carboxylate reductase